MVVGFNLLLYCGCGRWRCAVCAAEGHALRSSSGVPPIDPPHPKIALDYLFRFQIPFFTIVGVTLKSSGGRFLLVSHSQCHV